MTLAEAVRGAATRFRDAPALVAADRWVLAYGDLDRLSDEAAAGFLRIGVNAGDVVALALPSTPDYVVAYAGLAKIGAVTAGINPSLAPPERRALVEIVSPRMALTTGELRDSVPDAIETVEIVPGESPGAVLAEVRVPGESVPVLPAEPARDVCVVFTSGTTGIPKGAAFTERQLAAVTAIDFGDRWGGGGPMLAATQFAHVGFMTKLPWYLRSGARIHLLKRWRAADVLRIVAQERMASIGGVAPQIALLLAVPEFDTYDFDCVKTIVMGGGPSSPSLVHEARTRFGAAYSIRYSSTESGGVGTGTAFDAPDDEALWTVGRPRPGVEVEIRNDDGEVVPDGEVGEVCLRSDAVMDRYWGDDEATAATLRRGWLYSGDLGVIEPSGCLRLAGRKKEMFIRGGYNVFPMEVEAVLSSHPAVADVAVVPRPDPVMGEIGVAVVVPAAGADAPSLESLRAHARDRLAAWKLPEAIRVVDALPLTAMQKVDRRALSAAAASPLDTEP